MVKLTKRTYRDCLGGEHIKYKGLSDNSKLRYRRACLRFLEWRRLAGLPKPKRLSTLDFQCGEFVNFLYQDDRPMYWAGDFCSGMKRLYTKGRKAAVTADRYYKYWSKAKLVRRAFPISADLVRGMATYLLIKGRPRMALAFLLAFLGLWRMGEITALRMRQIAVLNAGLVLITFSGSESKGAQRKGEPETVPIRDGSVIAALIFLKSRTEPDDYLIGGDYRDKCLALTEAAAFFGVVHPSLTPHGFRRGGATWHFEVHESYDRTTCHGRWAHVATCRLYIDQARIDLSRAEMPSIKKKQLRVAVLNMNKLLMI